MSACDDFQTKVKAFFQEADTGKGITPGSLARVIKKACPNFKGTDADIASMFLDIDKDGDHLITWEEFSSALFAKKPKEVTRSELETKFKEIDTDGTGKLDKNEVRKWAQKYGHDWTDEQLEKVMKEADPNGDGVSYEEFLTVWGSA